MSTTSKSSGAAAAAGAQFESFFNDYTKNVTKEFERLASLRKEAFDAAAQAQKTLLEVAAERGRVAAKLTAENTESITGMVAGVLAVFEDLAGFATKTQKQAVDFAASQNASIYAAAQQQFEATGAAATETFQKSVDTVLEAQRAVLGAREAA